MVDRFRDGLLTPAETASYLEIPQPTLATWLKGRAAGAPLVHQVEQVRKGQPSVPFIAVAEAHVLRSLRSLGLRMSEIREAAAAVRDAFDTPYGLVSKRIATDGVDIFIEHGWGDLRRARDGQVPIQEVVSDLDNQQLRAAEMIERLVAHRDAIHRAVEKGGPAAYAMRSDRVEGTWP
ncbi:hypothetical protein AB0N31_16525 [Streptomyces sp. NPDC051051]|uniref:hypothetical protein n=1 Tax=Streptomyces sp. NPDC051051 TaxID=3155666 RepID=UPI00341B5D5F